VYQQRKTNDEAEHPLPDHGRAGANINPVTGKYETPPPTQERQEKIEWQNKP